MQTWHEAIGQEKEQDYFKQLLQRVKEARAAGKTVYPPNTEIFNAFKLTGFDQVKVVILAFSKLLMQQ